MKQIWWPPLKLVKNLNFQIKILQVMIDWSLVHAPATELYIFFSGKEKR